MFLHGSLVITSHLCLPGSDAGSGLEPGYNNGPTRQEQDVRKVRG